MKKVGGLFIRGSGFSAEQIAGYERDAKRLADWKAGKRPTAEETAASIARAEASEKAFQEWDKKVIKRSKR